MKKTLLIVSTCALAAAACAQEPVYVRNADGTMQQVVLQPDGTYRPVVAAPVVVQPAPPVVVQQGLTLPNGTVMPVGAKICPKCNGTGVKEHFFYSEKCPNCRGYGYKMPGDFGPDVIVIHDHDGTKPRHHDKYDDRHHGKHHDKHHDKHNYSEPPPGYQPHRGPVKNVKPAAKPAPAKPAAKPAPAKSAPAKPQPPKPGKDPKKK